MSKKGTIEVFQSKITRNDRFAQMSHQEKVIEQKKREIQARLEQKQKVGNIVSSEAKVSSSSSKSSKSPSRSQEKKAVFNVFSNDGSFLDQFKQLKDRKLDQKLKSFKSKDSGKNSEDRIKNSRWSQRRGSQSPKDTRPNKPRISRFSDKPSFEPKINISTTYSSLISQTNFDSITPQNVTGQPLLKNVLPPPGVIYPTPQTSAPVIAAPPVLLNMPPPQLIQSTITTTIVMPSTTLAGAQNVISSGTVLNTATLPPPAPLPPQNPPGLLHDAVSPQNVITIPPPCIPTIELASIPPPNPIQVHNIPQPEPINTLTIPPPAPMQVQNIPPPSPIQLNEIPNPKPIDLLNIPTPNDNVHIEKNISDPDFIKNIPPPNKSVPPPSLSEQNLSVNVNIAVPPPVNADVNVGPPIPTCLPPPNVIPPTSMPPPPQSLTPQSISQNIAVQNVPPPQNILVHTIPPPQTLSQNISQLSLQALSPLQNTQSIIQTMPPPINPNQVTLPVTPTITMTMPMQNTLPIGVPPPPPVTVPNTIPSLMAQPILPPPGMGMAPSINVSCPPPLLQTSSATLQQPPPVFVNQPPPLTTLMPPMNVPPPASIPMGASTNIPPTFRDLNAVFPPGTADYEAMASLGRMVAQCGPGIEDIVRQRKTQDPSLWFLFHKESAAYQQYQQLVEQFRAGLGRTEHKRIEGCYKPEDIYDLDSVNDEESNAKKLNENSLGESTRSSKRKRKTRWGEKDPCTTSPNTSLIPPVPVSPTSGNVMLTKINRNDPALIQYATATFGSSNLSEEDWKKAEDHYKINLLYQDMLRKRQELERLQKAGKNKYEYDSDEEIEGGTWEHKLREKEMIATQLWAEELTKQAEGKHHIGDFLPPEELKKFMEKSTAAKEGRQPSLSDYKEFKLKEDNIGFKMLQKLGWSEGQGLGTDGSGIVEPVNKLVKIIPSLSKKSQ